MPGRQIAMRRLFYLFLIVVVSGCSAEEAPHRSEIQESSSQGRDLNSDGHDDIFYEEDEMILYELLDKNFDGKIDESMQYSKKTDVLIGGKIDEDFDGYLETTLIAIDGIVSKALVDSNSNQVFDICFEYNHGVLDRAFRFHAQQEQSESRVSRVSFRFGYPKANEDMQPAMINEQDFHNIISNDDARCNLDTR
ncbi:MAG: hypothetical protein HUJ31_06065 [Pseudomonadales bacterium]|nr:hypothetical protein [Pseudomonadales bacterium]